jgi:cystathionine beta-lyase
MTHKELTEFFIHKVGIGINQGRIFGPGGNGYIRLNIATSIDILIDAMNRLKKATNLI